jgi:large subunit ribosomal protein L28
MSKTCEICGKHPMSGGTISHSHNVSKRIFYPNLRSVKTVVRGASKRVKVCMKCLKAMSK